ncbi:MAG: hypothetical protein RIC87_06325, partial [Kiloniellales bacterium]
LLGRSGGDSISGQNGDDFISGQGDEDAGDLLRGGSGSDTIAFNNNDKAFGGTGTDLFLFNGDETGQTLGGGTVIALARISDFHSPLFDGSSEQDSLVFASGLEVGVFSYIESAAFDGNANSQARFNDVQNQLEVDSDGDGTADMAVKMSNLSLANQLTAMDFLWL